jgi:hypothetical protein
MHKMESSFNFHIRRISYLFEKIIQELEYQASNQNNYFDLNEETIGYPCGLRRRRIRQKN